jgi:hypothetical protein
MSMIGSAFDRGVCVFSLEHREKSRSVPTHLGRSRRAGLGDRREMAFAAAAWQLLLPA